MMSIYYYFVEVTTRLLQVEELFKEHPDLLDEFKRFLPDNSATASATQVSVGRNSLPRNDEQKTSTVLTMRQTHVDKVVVKLYSYLWIFFLGLFGLCLLFLMQN